MRKAIRLVMQQPQSDGVYIRTRHDGRLFHLSDLKCKKAVTRLIIELLYADDVALVSHSERGLQVIADKLVVACDAFGLTISIIKTEVLLQAAPLATRNEPTVTVNGSVLKVVKQFSYLGSIVSDDGRASHEIEARVKKASVAFGMLRERVWKSHCIRLQTKLAIYKAVVLSTLLYGCETWTCYRKDIATLDSFHMRHLRTILGVKWQDFVKNAQVLRRCDMTGIQAYILHHRLRWCGHVMRMEADRLPRMLLLSELATGKRDLGRPLLRYKDTVKFALKACFLDASSLDEQSRLSQCAFSTAAQNARSQWRSSIHHGVEKFEQTRLAKAENARVRRKENQQRRMQQHTQQHTRQQQQHNPQPEE